MSYELARLAESAAKGAKAVAGAVGGESGGYVDEEAERLAELRMANRQKQQ